MAPIKACVLVTSRSWHNGMAERLQKECGCVFHRICHPEELNLARLLQIDPAYIFFPHWSWKIPEEIWSRYECVIFHMTDLPFGRGGSPLQNLIVRNIHETKISALRCVAELDAGPVYLKRPLSLYGSAEEIFLRAVPVIEAMIAEIVKKQVQPQNQEGELTLFKRRTPDQGNISELETLIDVYDYIRMLDADGYPPAFIETESFCFEFKRASLRYDCIEADVTIRIKNKSS